MKRPSLLIMGGAKDETLISIFDDVTVSRRHAEITRTGNIFELVDQRSLNGTYVNGERADRALLTDGAEVRIGKFRLNFFVAPLDRGQATGA